MTLLSKSAILCANDLQTEDVEVPEWGGVVRLRSFTPPPIKEKPTLRGWFFSKLCSELLPSARNCQSD
jgi:hypothetical protein